MTLLMATSESMLSRVAIKRKVADEDTKSLYTKEELETLENIPVYLGSITKDKDGKIECDHDYKYETDEQYSCSKCNNKLKLKHNKCRKENHDFVFSCKGAKCKTCLFFIPTKQNDLHKFVVEPISAIKNPFLTFYCEKCLYRTSIPH